MIKLLLVLDTSVYDFYRIPESSLVYSVSNLDSRSLMKTSPMTDSYPFRKE